MMRSNPANGVAPSGHGGFALPAAVLALVVVGVLITGGIHLASQESRIGQATERGGRAFYVAETGMSTVLGTWRPASHDLGAWGDVYEESGVTGDGEWDAVVRQVDERLYFVRSTGRVASRGGAHAERSLGVVARHFTAAIDPPAALQTMGEVRVAGSAEIRGHDQVPTGWGSDQCPDPLENLPGVVTDADGGVTTLGGAQVSGEPEHEVDPDLTGDDFRQFGDLTWEELTSWANIRLPGGNLDNPAPNPNSSSGPCLVSDPYNWGDPKNHSNPCGGYFPIVHVEGNASLEGGGVGQGILLVDGDLDLRGGFEYFGVIIVQGAFNVQGGGANGPRISGGVMAANADLDLEVNDDEQSMVGSSIVQNSRCAVNRAITENDALNRLRPLEARSWVDLTGASF